jgi:hypothetical protein
MHDGSSAETSDLELLAHPRFGDLTRAEKQFLSAAPKGDIAVCGPSNIANDPANDPRRSDEWGSERSIRAKLISWLCVEDEVAKKIDPLGIQVFGAKIVDPLHLLFVTIGFPLLFQHCRFNDDIDLKFCTAPALNLAGSSIRSFNMDGAHVRGDVALDLVTSSGEVRAVQAQIGGTFSCRASAFRNHLEKALSLDRAEIGGSVYLDGGFSADGEVRLPSAQIGHQIVFEHGAFEDVDLQGTVVKDSLHWRNVQKANRLDLTNASAGAIVDDEGSWPAMGSLVLDGLVYKRFLNSPTDAETRLSWVDRQGAFKPQPYLQLAKVLREAGDDRGARRVLFEMESRWRKAQDSRWYQKLWSQVLRKSIGYGQMSWWALRWLLLLAVVGTVVFGCGYLGGAMAPTDERAYEFFAQHGYAPDYYPQFNPLVYSIEHSFPLVSLGMKDRWSPNHGVSSDRLLLDWRGLRWLHGATFCDVQPFRWNAPMCLRLCLWLQVPLGWVLATLFVAGLTGVVKR